ncbi:hypothetical protein VB834_25285 [Limnoraphis robusta Tam1]|uniref:hypothetical protein n=1 Tax=Limnoraphis robusta TaxID=1118279 RepID=UPI002B1F174F|nr:hypothetical protein [Limnoraphis robusta]MEA5498197.1 hypothetical protein [Limnoraphis robusta BA-68 BA1]MEA5542348.1 hypothetical protein [Limnoraphis robusta Tam1]
MMATDIEQNIISISEYNGKLAKVLTSKNTCLSDEKTKQQILDFVAHIVNNCVIIQRELIEKPEPSCFDEFFDYDEDFYLHQTFGEKKEEIKKLYKQLPSDLRDDILRELQSVQ